MDRELQPERGWATPAGTRLPVRPLAERGWVFRAAGHALRGLGRDEVPDLFVVLHLSPRLFWTWLAFASRLMPYGRLPPRLREKLILRTAWNGRCRYEWGQHLDIAQRVGIAKGEIVALARNEPAESALERAALGACDLVCAGEPIDEARWSVLRGALSEALVLELLLLVGHYRMLAGVIVDAGLTLEAPFERAIAELSAHAHVRVGVASERDA